MIGYPFDSAVTVDEQGNITYDRAISSTPLKTLISKLFTTGVMPNPSDNLQVFAGSEGMTVIVHPGFCVIEGGLKLEETNRTLEIQAADTSYDRIDTVVMRWNNNEDVRTCDLYVLEGTPTSSPVRPTLTHTTSVYEIGLADIFVPRNVTSITQERITDTRMDASRCGIVSSISEFDTTTLYEQVQSDLADFKSEEQAQFLAWFATIQNILDENVAAHLQNEIDALTTDLREVESRIDIVRQFRIPVSAWTAFSDSSMPEYTAVAFLLVGNIYNFDSYPTWGVVGGSEDTVSSHSNIISQASYVKQALFGSPCDPNYIKLYATQAPTIPLILVVKGGNENVIGVPENRRLYLYNEGDECTDITGGWTTSGYSFRTGSWHFTEGTKGTNYLEVQSNNSDKYECNGFGTVNAIDCSDYSRICFLIDQVSGDDGISTRFWSTLDKTRCESAYPAWNRSANIGTDIRVTANTFSDSGSSFSTRYVVFFIKCSDSLHLTQTAVTRIKKIWLE